jgi:enoyl-CoA hydratase/carnithine racemase
VAYPEKSNMPNPASQETPFVLSELSEGVCWLTLNRPKQRNPLSSGMIAAIKQDIDAASDNPQVRVIVLAGSGPVFSAGHDLAEMTGPTPDDYASRDEHLRDILNGCSEMMLSIMHCPKAVIACVQGTATAAGCQLVSACDLALASEEAHFCTPGVNIGSFCTTPLVGIGRNMHRKHAMELALTGDMFCAEDAVRMGLINRTVAASELQAEVSQLAGRIASKSAQGIRSGKQAFYQQIDMPVEGAFEYAREEMIKALTGADSDEGIKAFFEKRPPQWGDA